MDMLTCLGIKPAGFLGHSVGEIACAYADGCLTAEETVLTTFMRGRCLEEAGLPLGGMAAVGKEVLLYFCLIAFNSLSYWKK